MRSKPCKLQYRASLAILRNSFQIVQYRGTNCIILFFSLYIAESSCAIFESITIIRVQLVAVYMVNSRNYLLQSTHAENRACSGYYKLHNNFKSVENNIRKRIMRIIKILRKNLTPDLTGFHILTQPDFANDASDAGLYMVGRIYDRIITRHIWLVSIRNCTCFGTRNKTLAKLWSFVFWMYVNVRERSVKFPLVISSCIL